MHYYLTEVRANNQRFFIEKASAWPFNRFYAFMESKYFKKGADSLSVATFDSWDELNREYLKRLTLP